MGDEQDRGTAYDFDETYGERFRDHEVARLRLQAEQMWGLEQARAQAAGLRPVTT